MIIPGLVSITFRKLAPREIIGLVQQAGLNAIEWGGDVHVPHGDLDRAREVRQLTEEAGLEVSAYGSYYRTGESEAEGLSFDSVLETARTLGTPIVRVWAGQRGSADADAEYRRRVVEDSRRLAGRAQTAGIVVAFEYHNNTLNDTPVASPQLLSQVGHANVKTYWQPPDELTADQCVAALQAILGRLANLHVFHWRKGFTDRRPLAEGAEDWRRYFAIARQTGRRHVASVEYVQNDDPAAFLADAATLKQLLESEESHANGTSR